MAENKQKSETENRGNSEENKTGGATTTAASAKPAKENASPTATGSATETAKDTINQVKETAGNVAGKAVEQVKEKAGSVLGDQKTNLASGVASVAESIRQVGENLGGSDENNQIAALAGKYGDTLAAQVERVSSYIDEKEISELVTDVEQFARRNPMLFVGGAFVLGIFAARFLKSSGRGKRTAKRS